MKKTKPERIHRIIHVLSFSFVLVFFIFQLKASEISTLIVMPTFAITLSAAIVVNIIKLLRLYVILFGSKYNFRDYVNYYSLTTLINYVFPYKLGEFYRGYCFGRLIGSYINGYIIVFFDRFVDTLGLITVIFVFGLCTGFEITLMYLLLALFLFSVMFLYFCFPSLYAYWNHFLIYNKQSERTLKGLHFLSICNEAYRSIKFTIKGRFIITYTLSVFAWGIEILTLYLMKYRIGSYDINAYLVSLLSGNWNFADNLYSCANFILLLSVELVILLNKLLRKKDWGLK